MNIAIVGAGNVGVAMATDLSLRGHSVTIVKSSNSVLHSRCFQMLQGNDKEVLLKENGIYHTTTITECTNDILAIKGKDVVFVTVQTQYHQELIKKMLGFMSTNQVLVFVPSYMASMYVQKFIHNDIPPTIVELTGPPVEGRIEMDMIPGKVVFRVGSRLKEKPASVTYNGVTDERANEVIDAIGYGFTPTLTPIQAALLNPNLVIHTVGSILSIPRIEKAKENFCMYHEAYSRDNQAMIRLVEKLDSEKNAILSHLGYKTVGFLQTADFWGDNAMEKFLQYAESNDRANAPTSIHARYITEDVSQGLVLLESLGKYFNVRTPIATALINIADAALETDFRKNGRTVKRLSAKSYLHSLTH